MCTEQIKLQRNSEKYELLRNDIITNTDKEDFVYTKVNFYILLFDFQFLNNPFFLTMPFAEST